MADHDAQTITNLIDSNFDHMEKALSIFENEGIETQEDLRDTIGKITSLLSLSRFALIVPSVLPVSQSSQDLSEWFLYHSVSSPY